MKPIPTNQILLATTFVLVIFAATPAAAWHWEDEERHERFNSLAGDPRVQEDAGRCFNETTGRDDIGCIVFYGQLPVLGSGLMFANTQRLPDCAPGTTYHPSTMNYYMEPHRLSWTYTSLHAESCDELPTGWWPWLQANVSVSPATGIEAYLYLRGDATQASNPDDPALGILPCLTVEMTLYDSSRHDDRREIATGSTTKSVLTLPSGSIDPVEDPCPGSTGMIREEAVTEFIVDLDTVASRVPLKAAPYLETVWYQWDGEPGGVRGGTNGWSVISSPEHQNRFIFPVEDALTVQSLDLVEEEETKIRILAQSAWGATDVDPENVRVQLFDEEENEVPLSNLGDKMIANPLDNQTPGVYYPVNITFPWNHSQEELDPGDYTLRVTVTNWQHTRDASRHLNFTLDEDNNLQVHTLDEDPSDDETTITPLGQLVLPYVFSGLVLLLVALVLSVAWTRRNHW